MGQKVNPNGLRVGVIRDWESKWYADKKDFADMLVEDNEIREFIKKKLYAAGISKVVIERPGKNRTRITVLTARPGMVIGKSGNGIDELKAQLAKKIGKDVDISIQEVRRSELDAQLTAESVAQALERRTSFRRAMKQAIQRTMKAGAKGCKITCSGRLGGARSPDPRNTQRATFLFTRSELTSTTDSRRQTLRTAASVSRSGSITAKCSIKV